MNQPTLLTGQVYAVEVPDGAEKFRIMKYSQPETLSYDYSIQKGDRCTTGLIAMIDLPAGNWQLIGTTKECTEESAAQIVERATGGFSGRMTGYKDYVIAGLDMQPLSNAVESLRTLLTSKGLDQNKNYVLLKKKHEKQ